MWLLLNLYKNVSEKSNLWSPSFSSCTKFSYIIRTLFFLICKTNFFTETIFFCNYPRTIVAVSTSGKKCGFGRLGVLNVKTIKNFIFYSILLFAPGNEKSTGLDSMDLKLEMRRVPWKWILYITILVKSLVKYQLKARISQKNVTPILTKFLFTQAWAISI